MQCSICKNHNISPRINPFGGFLCVSLKHIQCVECNFEADRCCLVCGKLTQFLSMTIDQPPKTEPSTSRATPQSPPITTESTNVSTTLEEPVKKLSPFDFPVHIRDDIENQPNISDEDQPPFYEYSDGSDSYSEVPQTARTSSVKLSRKELHELSVITGSVVASSSVSLNSMELGIQYAEANLNFEVDEKEDNPKKANTFDTASNKMQMTTMTDEEFQSLHSFYDISKGSQIKIVPSRSLLQDEDKVQICNAFQLNPDMYSCQCGGIILHVRPRGTKCCNWSALKSMTKKQPIRASSQTEIMLIDSLAALVDDNRSTLMLNRQQLAANNGHQLNVIDTSADYFYNGTDPLIIESQLACENTLGEPINDVKSQNEYLKFGQRVSETEDSPCSIPHQRPLYQNRSTQIPLWDDYPNKIVNSEEKHAEKLPEDLGTTVAHNTCLLPYEPYISQSPLCSDCKIIFQQGKESKPKSSTQPVGVESSVDFLNYFQSNRNIYMERMHGRVCDTSIVDEYKNQTCDSGQTPKSDNNSTVDALEDESLDLVFNSATELPVSDQHELSIVNEPHTEKQPKCDYNSVDSFDLRAAGDHVDPDFLHLQKESFPCPVCLNSVNLSNFSGHLIVFHNYIPIKTLMTGEHSSFKIDPALLANREPTVHCAYIMSYVTSNSELQQVESFFPLYLMSACITVPPNSDSAIEEKNHDNEHDDKSVYLSPSDSSSESQTESISGKDKTEKRKKKKKSDLEQVMIWLAGKEPDASTIPVELSLSTLSGTIISVYSGEFYSIYKNQNPASVVMSGQMITISSKSLDQLTNNCTEMIEAVVTTYKK